ncbi:MAG: GMC family oxidoreductase [Pseudomonadota bacterium]
MLFDANAISPDTQLEADICIIGGGAAGISAALALEGSGLKVLLVEGGSQWADDQSQSVYDAENLGLDLTPVAESRLRMLGGSTNHWAGNCMRFEAIDFEAREGIPYSGWPISLSDIEPYYMAAQALVETPTDAAYDVAERYDRLGLPVLDFQPDLLKTHLYSESPPTAFGNTYEEDLTAAQDVACYVNATALELMTDSDAARVTSVRMSSLSGTKFSIVARRVVVATGGMEVPRLLLLSNSTAVAGLGNQNDVVGRFFMDHIAVRPSLRAMISRRVSDFDLYTEPQFDADGYFRAAISASEELLRRENLPNFLIFLMKQSNSSPGQQSGQALRRGPAPGTLGTHILNVVTDLDGLTNEVFRTISGSRDDLIERTWLDPWLTVESRPNPDSRVLLADELDPVFGQRKLALDWQLHEDDLDSNRRITEILAQELGRMGYGRVWSDLLRHPDRWPTLGHGKHHSGTARMAADPKQGVVDGNCKVHGVANLYVAGSAVFPTHGYATPTLTIVAMALRLADHLKETMQTGAE